ncbi:MAG: hypothetical protein WBO17_09795 [Sphingorhabdus sp.]
MGPFEMVVAIIAIVTIGKVLSARYKAKHGILEIENEDGYVQQKLAGTSDTDRMQDEIKLLKDRIHVLERIATDTNSTHDLNRQIEELRGR